jgi:CYTH domain-containing protein/predicted ATPase
MLKKIVLTGGPCAGKTTALNYLYEKLSDYGYSVIIVPEIPTFVINSGLHPPKTDLDYFAFQKLMLEAQVLLEDKVFVPAAKIKGGEKQVIIFDRGCMDYRAYMSQKEFEKVLQENRWGIVDLRDKRYDAVIHLVTAADGQSAFYNYNNSARRETPEEAVKADARTRAAWLGHPHLRVIDNSTDFEGKMRRLLNIIRGILGIPVALEMEKKFIINSPLHLGNIPCPCQVIEIEQAYIGSDITNLVRIRCRSQKDQGAVYYETKKLNTGSDVTRVETERQITKEMYDEKMKYRDPDTDVIRKTRICFLYKNQYFELDFFMEPERLRGLMLLEIELTNENESVEIPKWLGEVEDVTLNLKYKNDILARKPNTLLPRPLT